MDLVPPVMPGQKSTYTPVQKSGATSDSYSRQYAKFVAFKKCGYRLRAYREKTGADCSDVVIRIPRNRLGRHSLRDTYAANPESNLLMPTGNKTGRAALLQTIFGKYRGRILVTYVLTLLENIFELFYPSLT
jgi:hypothetical protein